MSTPEGFQAGPREFVVMPSLNVGRTVAMAFAGFPARPRREGPPGRDPRAVCAPLPALLCGPADLIRPLAAPVRIPEVAADQCHDGQCGEGEADSKG